MEDQTIPLSFPHPLEPLPGPSLSDSGIVSQPESILPDVEDESIRDFSFAAASEGLQRMKVDPDYLEYQPDLSLYNTIIVSPSEPVRSERNDFEFQSPNECSDPDPDRAVAYGAAEPLIIKVEPMLGNLIQTQDIFPNKPRGRKEELKEKYKPQKRGRSSHTSSSSKEPKSKRRKGPEEKTEALGRGNKKAKPPSTRGKKNAKSVGATKPGVKSKSKAEVALEKITPSRRKPESGRDNVKSQEEKSQSRKFEPVEEDISLDKLIPVIVPKKINRRFKCRVRMMRMSRAEVNKYIRSDVSYSSRDNDNGNEYDNVGTSAWSPPAHYPSDNENDNHPAPESARPSPSKKSQIGFGIFIPRPTGISKRRRGRDGPSKGRRQRSIFTCEYCKREFPVQSSLVYHQNQIPADPPYECQICQESFKLANCMNYHLRNVHADVVGPSVTKVVGVKGPDLDSGKTIVCDDCGKRFSTMVGLNLHKKQKHVPLAQNYICKVGSCGKTFTKQNHLDDHMIIHAAATGIEPFVAEKPFSCDECVAQFSCRSHLTVHKRVHQQKNGQFPVLSSDQTTAKDSLKSFFCELCTKGFTRYAGLAYHLKAIHSGNPIERKFACSECPRTFISKGHLTQHLKMYPGKGEDHKAPNYSHECEVCGKAYLRAIQLQNHQRCHTGEKVKCRHCPAEFEGLYLRSVHEKDVHGVFTFKKKRYDNFTRRFACPMGDCDRAFYSKQSLGRHIQSHTGEKPHLCTECGASYKSAISLKEHTMTIHTKETPYKCPHCEEAFSRKLSWNYHILANHTPGAKKYACDRCPMTFLMKGFLDAHMRSHSSERKFSCHLCPARYKNPHSLTLHLRRCGNPNAPVPKRKRRPGIGVGAGAGKGKPRPTKVPRVETEEGPKYPCTICGNLFMTDHNRRIHELIHSGKKDFKCSNCGKAFYTKAKLKVHEKRHTGILDFACKLCGRAFFSNDKVKIHMKTHMKNPEKWDKKPRTKCPQCTKSFFTPKGLESHMNRAHGSGHVQSHSSFSGQSTNFSATSHEDVEIYDPSSNSGPEPIPGPGHGYQFPVPVPGPSHSHNLHYQTPTFGYGSRPTHSQGQYPNLGTQGQALDFSDALAQTLYGYGSGSGHN